MKYAQTLLTIAAASFSFAASARADGIVVDKLYHPYVDALEQELEYRGLVQSTQPGVTNQAQLHQMSLGTSLGEHFFGEVYLVGAKDRAKGFETETWEAELKWQLTEQGEYAIDWGMLFEYEDEIDADIHEFSVGILAEKEWGRISGTANVMLIQEWGRGIADELESVVALQARYRYKPLLEPTLEFYAGQHSRGFGPVLQGNVKTGTRKSVHWEAGAIFGLTGDSPDHTWRFQFEYEF